MAPRGNQAKKDPTAEKEPIKLPSYTLHLVRDIIDQLTHYAADTGTNEVSGTSEFLPLEPPVRVTGAGKSSLGGNHTKLMRLHIFQARELGDGLK